MRIILLTVAFSLFTLCGFAQIVTISDSVYFDKNDTSFTAASTSVLHSFKNKLYGRKIIAVNIIGNADNAGSAGYNQRLGLLRASKIRNWFQEKMADEDAFSKAIVISLGEKHPVNNNATDEDKALNRRVYINAEVDYTPFISIKTLNCEVEDPYQLFCIDNKRDTMLICRRGTMVYIRANSIDKDNCKENCITIQIKEALYKEDILRNNLTTNSDDKILISQSMVYVNALCDQQELSLYPGNDYVIFSPAAKKKELNGAGIYDGIRDTAGNINWIGVAKDVKAIDAASLANCNGSRMRCGKGKEEIGCDTCHLIFCGVGRVIKFSFQEDGKIKKQEYKNCRRNAMEKRKTKRQGRRAERKLKKLDKLQLAPDTANSPLPCYFDAVGPCGGLVSAFDMNCAINFEKDIAASLDSVLKNGNPINVKNINELQYAVFKRNGMGWSNVDWIMKISPFDKKDIRIDLEATPYTDAKIIFTDHKTILRAIKGKHNKLVLPDMPINEPAVLLIVDTRTGKDKILVQKREITTGGFTIEPEFKLMSVGEYAALLSTFN